MRELAHVVLRLLINAETLTDADATRKLLPRPDASPDEKPDPGPAPQPELETLDAAERRHVIAVLADSGGNRSEAARRLGIERKTLTRKLKSWNEGAARPEEDEG